MHLLHRAAHHLSARYLLFRTEYVLRFVIAIDVGRHEIHRYLLVPAMPQECRDPGRLRGRRSADAQPCIDRLETAGRVLVERKVGRLLRLASPEIEVGLVPHLEIPLADLIDPITLDQMARERRIERVPAFVVRGRRYDRAIPEAVADLARS